MTDTIRWADIVGDGEIAGLFGVGRSTIAHWKSRYPDFPPARATIGAGRKGPRTDTIAFTELRDRAEVLAWGVKTGRLTEETEHGNS